MGIFLFPESFFYVQKSDQLNPSIFLQHLLPLNIISSSSLSIVYNVMDFGAENRFSYKAAFAFHNEETCGPRRISIPIGIIT